MRTIIIILVACVSVACASNPDNIAPAYVSPLKYADYTCNQISQELDYVGQRTNALYQSLRRKRTADNWQMGIGIVLFWPTLFALEGGDGPEATEYAQIQGEFEALRQNAVSKGCNLNLQSPDEILTAASEADSQSEGSEPVNSALSERLQELEDLRSEGLITEEEHQAARRSVLGIE